MSSLPQLRWKPTPVSAAVSLKSGAVEKFPTREATLRAIDAARAKSPQTVFFAQPSGEGWALARFTETQRTSAQAAELKLKFTQAPHPEAFLVDAHGAVSRVDSTPHAGWRGLQRVARDAFEAAPVATVGARVLPRVPAAPQTNHGKNVSWSPKWAFRPGRDINALADTMKFISTKLPGVAIKAGGSRHSWSPAAATDGVYIHPEGMKFSDLSPARTPAECLKPTLSAGEQKHLVRLGSGTTIREANTQLWARGLAFPWLGGYDGQTLGGVMPTGTHGSVLSGGPMADLIRSVDLVTPSGERVRLEPADGPTDPTAFARTHPGFRLIQDDTTFQAAKINLGTFGVVHSYLLTTTDAFYLNEKRTLTTGAALKNVLAKGNLYNLMQNEQHPPQPTARTLPGQPTPAYHLEFWWNVHTDTVLTTSRQPLSKQAAEQLKAHEPRGFARPTRDLVRILSTPDQNSRPKLNRVMSDVLTGVVDSVGGVARSVHAGVAVELLDGLFKGMADDAYTQRSYNVFNIGDGANELSAQSATLSVPLEGDAYLRAMDIISKTARDYAKEHHVYQTGPVSLRFVKASDALLSPGKDVCNFELIFAGDSEVDQRNARALTDAYVKALRAEFGNDVGFHLGQLAPSAPTPLRAVYPRLGDFEQVRKQFDPQGVMANPWQKALLAG